MVDRLLAEREVKKWLDRWKGYINDDLINCMKISINHIPPVKHQENVIAEIKINGDELHELVEKAVNDIKVKYDWIPVNKKPAEYPCLACDKLAQIFIPNGVVEINDHFYDGSFYEFDNEKFLQGHEIETLSGIKGRVLPREIIAWMPLPEPYIAKNEQEG